MKTKKLRRFLTAAASISALATVGTSAGITLNTKQEDVYKTIRQNIIGQSRTFSDSWTDVISASGKKHFFKSLVSVDGMLGIDQADSAVNDSYDGHIQNTTTHYKSLDISKAGQNMKALSIEFYGSQNEGATGVETPYNRKVVLSPTLYTEFSSNYTVKTINYHIDYHSYVQTEALWFRHSLDTTIVIDSIDYVAKKGTELWIDNITEKDSYYEQYTTTIFEYWTFAYFESVISVGNVNTLSADRFQADDKLGTIVNEGLQDIVPVTVDGLSNQEAIRGFSVQSAHAMSNKQNLHIKEYSHENTVNLSALKNIDTTQFSSMQINFKKEITAVQRSYHALYMHILASGFGVESISLVI